jgi:hypothetical protein
MKKLSMLVLLGGIAMVGFGAPAQAGCLTGAAIGGVAGHVAGHHGVLGAAVGCAVGHHRSESRREEYADRGYQRDGAYRRGPDRQMYGRDAYRPDEQR